MKRGGRKGRARQRGRRENITNKQKRSLFLDLKLKKEKTLDSRDTKDVACPGLGV